MDAQAASRTQLASVKGNPVRFIVQHERRETDYRLTQKQVYSLTEKILGGME